MTQRIPLVEIPDSFEIIRDYLAVILHDEMLDQQAQAVDKGLEPEEWRFRIFQEHSNPWEAFLCNPSDVSPIVNIWYDSKTYDKRTSNHSTRQKATSRYNIDCIVYAESKETATGHLPGDSAAAKKSHRTARIIRRILMHDKYRNLDLPIVWERWIASEQAFQPKSGNQTMQHVMGLRIALDVDHDEFIDLEDEQMIEQIQIAMARIGATEELIINIYPGT